MAGFVVFVGQDPGGGNGRAVLPVGSGPVDDRPALLERDGTRRLPGLSGFDGDPTLRAWNLWGYIDARDGAQAVRLALAASRPGADVFVIAAADTVMSRSSTDLATRMFPYVPVARVLGEHETMLGIDKARRVRGSEPTHSWRDHARPSGTIEQECPVGPFAQGSGLSCCGIS